MKWMMINIELLKGLLTFIPICKYRKFLSLAILSPPQSSLFLLAFSNVRGLNDGTTWITFVAKLDIV